MQLLIFSFMPHGMCYLWKPELVGLHLVSDGIIALAYFSIPFTLLYILRQRQDIPFNRIFLLFAAFILFCGSTHAFNIWTLWHPNYWLAGIIKLLTAMVSLATAFVLAIKIPQILKLPSPRQIEQINQQLQTKLTELQQQSKIIHQQAEFFHNIYDNLQEAIFVINVTEAGDFVYAGFNSAAKKLTGVEEVINKKPEEIFPPEIASALVERYKSCLEGKKTLSYEEYFILAGENTCWLTNLHPLATSTGRIYRIIATSLNITQRKIAETELDKEKKFLQALLDNLSDGIVACDKEGILTLLNQASKDFHGLPQQAISAEEWAKYYDLYLPDGKTLMPQAEIPLFRALQGESVRDVEMMIIPENGEPRTLLANGDPIIDSKGEKIGAIVAMRDITERKQAQQALAQINAQLNQELEQRVEERTAQLKQLNTMLLAATTTLEKRNQELDQFAYVASHDLKAPLRAIANLSAWIEEDLEDKLDEDTRHKMNLLRGRVHRLENLINGLLTYSRVGRLKSTPQEVDVQVMLGEIINSLDIPANFTINILGEMPTLVTELLPLQQVFTNLLSNAIKHSECGDDGKIAIAVKELDDYYEFTVSDNGKGIEPQYHERIFTVFQTLEARDTKESTGIGLAIVKKAVENQGGKITIESEVGKGTTFSFTWSKSAKNVD